MNSIVRFTLKTLVIVPAAAALLYMVICIITCWILTTPFDPISPIEPNPAVFGLEYDEVRFPARNDRLEIAGWFIPNPASQSAIILIHGRNENRASAMSGTFPQFAATLHDAGFAVLMIDMRGHGQSDPARYDFGLNSKNDVLGAVDWLLTQGFEPGNIGALGISMGGAAVNYAAAEEPAIGAVVGDSTFADVSDFADFFWTHTTRMPAFFLPGIFYTHQVLFGYDMRDSVPVEAVRQMEPRPYLIVHCASDNTVPYEEAEQMAEAVDGAEIWRVDTECEHAQINAEIPEEYEEHIITFFVNNLP